MNYIYEFDIAAILINAVVILFYFIKKSISTRQNKTFFVILLCLASSSVLDFLLTIQLMYNIPFPVPILWILNCLNYTTTNVFGVLLAMYICSLVDYPRIENKKRLKIVKRMISIPFIISLIIIWGSPISYSIFNYPLVFYLDAVGSYFRGHNIFFYLLYLFCGYYVILGFVLLIYYRKRVATSKIVLLFIYIILVFLTVVLQLYFPNILVQCFGMSITSLVFFIYIQRPEEVLNSVTELFNQTAFAKVVTQEIASYNKVTCISIILDDTHFLSNTFGISRLDDFMREVANYFKQNFKYKDIYHLSQGCFCVVFKDTKDEDLQTLVKKLQSRFNQVWHYESIHIKLYSRICVINCPAESKNAEDIIDIINLVSSDERYKQPVVYANEIDLEYKRRTMYIEHAVRTGISDNRMDVYYQPIWSTKENRLIGAEALIRLKDEEGNFISPEDFIPIAEKSGSILRIGEFVFESVCRTLSLIDVEEYGIKKIDINLSVAQCMQEILAEQILTIRSMYNVPAELINLEITETAAAHTPKILLKNMQHLSDAGFELSLDDYGSGYSNMNYMLNLPFKMIKIDKYIVWSAFENERANTALEATVSMIRKLDMTVLAEGVETEEQVKWLTKLGCDYLQGYYYSKPVPKEEYLKLMLEDKQRFEKEKKAKN